MGKNKELVKEKTKKENKINLLAMWKEFLSSDEIEKSEEEEILENTQLTDKQKKELIASLKNNDKMASKMFRNSYKTANLKVDPKASVEKISINKGKSKQQVELDEEKIR